MSKFLMDKTGDDLDSFLNDFWLYLDENSKSMEEENPAIEKLLYSLADVCEEFSYGYGKNQLPQGRYIIGRDLPEGTFDFTWVWGEGYLFLYKTDENTTLGNNLYLENVGIAHEYQYRQCLHLQCTAGNMLIIGGNLIVEISRSPKLKIDL